MPLVFETLKTSKKDFHRSEHQKRKDEIRPFSILADFNPLELIKILKLYHGEWGIRTPAPVTRPNDLANRPLQPLE